MKRFLLFGIWLVFVALLLQLAGWVYFTIGGAKPIEGYGYPAGLVVAHPQLGYAYRPGFTGRFKGAGYREVTIAVNGDGFRDRPFSAPSPGETRIAFLGDSVVMGPGVAAEERFTECLEDAPDAAGGSGRSPTILNLGVHSYSFGHYLTLAELGLEELEPTALVVGLTLNDFAPMAEAGPARRLARRAEGLHKPDWVARIQERLGGTYAGRFLSELENRIKYAFMSADRREEYHTKWMRTLVAAWEEPGTKAGFAADLDRLSDVAKAAALPLGFVLFPELNDVLDPDSFSAPRRTMLELLAARGLAVCDPYAAFAAHPEPTSLFLPHDSVHYSPAGHRLVCGVVQRCLRAWGFLYGAASADGEGAGAPGAQPSAQVQAAGSPMVSR